MILIYSMIMKRLAVQLKDHFPEFDFCDNKQGLYEEYLDQRNLMRFFYNKKENLLDRHKVCDCMTAVIIKVRLLNGGVEDDEGALLSPPRVNEQLVFMSAGELFVSNQMDMLSTPLIANVFS